MTSTAAAAPAAAYGKTTLSIILAVSLCHFINDINQSLLTAIYPHLKVSYGLDFVQIGLLTFVFQVTASLLQPVIGIYTDKRPLPYSIAAGMGSTLCGLLVLGYAQSYALLLVGAALIGLGSAIFHPESSRVARLASGGRHGLAQSLFQVGGNAGSAAGPLLAIWIVAPRGQASVAWFAVGAFAAILILTWVGRWYAEHRRANAGKAPASTALPFPPRTIVVAFTVLMLLTFSKNIYNASLGSYYTFFAIEKFHVSIEYAQMLLFVFLGASAVGVIIGGPIGDRFGAKFVIWFSILGVVPFTLALPYADLQWLPILTVFIGLIFSSAFPAIVVFAQELLPGRIGLVAGVFFGFAFGSAGIAAAVLGAVADVRGIEFVFQICSYLPFLGLLAAFLPDMTRTHGPVTAAVK